VPFPVDSKFPDLNQKDFHIFPRTDNISSYSRRKWVLDTFFAAFLLVLLFPLLFFTTILLFVLNGQVLYSKPRIGFNQKPFTILKFVTMIPNSHNMTYGTMTIGNDPRITPIGRILRKFKIDELPQLWNVLIGNMSFVGPRPLDKSEFDCYSDEVKNKIYSVKPGITGVGSIVFRNEDKILSDPTVSPISLYKQKIAPHKGELELWYLENQSFYVDFMILLLTGLAIFVPNNQLIYRVFPSLPVKPF
jgi:lipopolysaccharide/colanic/teichoic acid biosynthesis glycosyltransferase